MDRGGVTGPAALQDRGPRGGDDVAVAVAHRDHVTFVHRPWTIGFVVVGFEVGQPGGSTRDVGHHRPGEFPARVHARRVGRCERVDHTWRGVVFARIEHGAGTEQRARIPLVRPRW